MKLMCLDIHSLLPKIQEFRRIVSGKNCDIITVTETWLSQDIPNEIVLIDGYRLLRRDRYGRGGGVAIYVKASFDKVAICNHINYVSFTLKNKSYCVGVIIRSPSKPVNVPTIDSA